MMVRRIQMRWLVSVVLIAGAAARATTLARMTLRDMAHVAELVVRARCVESLVRWDAGEIWTFTTFEIEEAWKGSPPRQIVVRLLGGTTAELTSSVDGVPRFRAGEEVVLFLSATGRGDYSVVSWMQGTFRVARDRETGRASATQDTAAFATFDPVTRQFIVNGIRNRRLEQLRKEVEAALGEKAGRAE
jgi:hypothetical protein